MNRVIENRFEVLEDGSIHDMYSENKVLTISVPKSYMEIKYKAGFIQPLAYDEEEKKAIVSFYEEIDKTETNNEETVLKEFLPLLSALETLHQKNLVYGNLEPKKLVHQEDGYYLKDFGIGKEPKETNDYSAYEYFAYQGQGCMASDVYSVCAILYEIFTGIHLPNAEARMDYPDLEPLIAFGITEQTANVIQKGLSIFSDDRFPNMTEFLTSLYGEKKLENFQNDWSIRVRRMKNSEDVIAAKINRKQVAEKKEESFSVEEEKFPTDYKKKYYGIFLGIGAIILLGIVFLSFFRKDEPEFETIPTIQMTALPVASGGMIDYSATGSAVTATAIEVTETPIETETPKETEIPKITSSPTPKITVTPTVTPTAKPISSSTPKPTKKPKQTPKPQKTQKPKTKKTPKPTVTKKPVKKTPKPTKKPKFQLKDDFSLG